MGNEYGVRNGFHISKKKAQVFGDEWDRLRAEGDISRAGIVEAATPEDSPIHYLFEWDNDKIAQKAREDYAGYLQRAVVIIEERELDDGGVETIEIQYIHPIEIEEETRFVSINEIMEDSSLYKQVLAQARKDLQSVQRKLWELQGLPDLCAEIGLCIVNIDSKLGKEPVNKGAECSTCGRK